MAQGHLDELQKAEIVNARKLVPSVITMDTVCSMMTSSNGNIFPRYWPFVRGIHRSPVNSPHKGQWRRALMLSLICAWINGWVNNRDAGDLRRHRAPYDVTVMSKLSTVVLPTFFWRCDMTPSKNALLENFLWANTKTSRQKCSWPYFILSQIKGWFGMS